MTVGLNRGLCKRCHRRRDRDGYLCVACHQEAALLAHQRKLAYNRGEGDTLPDDPVAETDAERHRHTIRLLLGKEWA